MSILNQPFSIGRLTFPHRLIQGPLAGYSCAPFRTQFTAFKSPAYCVSEMLSAYDVVHKHQFTHRLLFRDPKEKKLAYQLSGTDPEVMGEAAARLENLGADLIDLNCGCPKSKIRKKGAGSALLSQPLRLIRLIETLRQSLTCPLTVKIRIQKTEQDLELARLIAEAGADALIVHGRRWDEDYSIPCDWNQIAKIKQTVSIPVIANGDIKDPDSLTDVLEATGCDGFMISRAGTGKPWLFQTLLGEANSHPTPDLIALFLQHLTQLATLEGEHLAVLQGRSLVRYYFRDWMNPDFLANYYLLDSIKAIEVYLKHVT